MSGEASEPAARGKVAQLSLKKLLWLAPLALGLPYLWKLLGTIAARLPYPYDLEWMEGGVLAQAWRLQNDLPVYQPPTVDWVPQLYPPGYSFVLATLAEVFPLGAPLGRAVSVTATLAAVAALLFFSWRRYRTIVPGLIAGLLYLLAYPHVGAFMDLVRADALFVGLTAWCVVLAFEESRAARRGSALLLFLAFAVKHNAALIGIPLVLGLWAQRGFKHALGWALWSAVPALLWLGWMQWHTDGAFLTYLLEVAVGAHPVLASRGFPGTPREVANAFPLLMPILALGALYWGARDKEGRFQPAALALAAALAVVAFVTMSLLPAVRGTRHPSDIAAYPNYLALGALAGIGLHRGMQVLRGAANLGWFTGGALLLTAFIMTALMRIPQGGFINNFMLLYWMLALALIPVVVWSAEKATPVWWTALLVAMAGVLVFQGGSDVNHRWLRPTVADYAAGDKVVVQLQAIEGTVLSPYASWLPALAGKEPSWHLMSLWDVDHEDGPYRENVSQVTLALRAGHFDAVLSSSEKMGFGIGEGYEPAIQLRLPKRALLPKTGWGRRPTQILKPRVKKSP